MSLKLLLSKIAIPLVLVGGAGGAIVTSDKSFDELIGKIGIDVNNKVQVREIFDKIDKDNSGRISRAELKAGFAAAGLKLQEKKLDVIMGVVDEDHDGGISFEEWENALKHQHSGSKLNPEVGHAVAKGATFTERAAIGFSFGTFADAIKTLGKPPAPKAPEEGKANN